MTEEQIHRARSIIAYAAENSSETEEVRKLDLKPMHVQW